jgi:hypothetical protein
VNAAEWERVRGHYFTIGCHCAHCDKDFLFYRSVGLCTDCFLAGHRGNDVELCKKCDEREVKGGSE